MSTANKIYVVNGKRGDSGYTTFGNVESEENKKETSRWISIGGMKLRGVSDKLYFSSHGDYIIAAYNSNDFTVRSFWNVTKNEGKLINIIHLIFHPYFWTTALTGACFLLAFKKEIQTEESFKQYAWGAYVLTLVIIFIYSFLDWRKDKMASDKVEEIKNKL